MGRAVVMVSFLLISAPLLGRTPSATQPPKTHLFLVESNEHQYGYVDQKGKLVIPPRFTLAWPFSTDGVALVHDDGGAGYIDTKGHYLNRAKYFSAMEFSEGAAVVNDGSKNDFYFIDTHFKPLFTKRFKGLRSFSNGLAAAQQDKLWGFVDREGEFVIKPQFLHAYEFSEEMAVVEAANHNWIFIDKQGNQLKQMPEIKAYDYIRFNYGAPWVFKTHLIEFMKNGAWGAVSPAGKEVIPFKYASLEIGEEGLISASQGTGAAASYKKIAGRLARNGEWYFQMDCQGMGPYGGGLAAVKVDGKWGFVNSQGRMVIGNIFDYVHGPFRDGFAIVSLDKKLGLIDKNGKFVWKDDGQWNHASQAAAPLPAASNSNYPHTYGYYSTDDPTGKMVNSWFGHRESELIEKWGPPARSVPDGIGSGHIDVFENTTSQDSYRYVPAMDTNGRYIGGWNETDTNFYKNTYNMYIDDWGNVWKGSWNVWR